MAEDRQPSPADETRRLYEEAETRTARAFEQLVARDSFGELLAKVTENVVGLTKITTDAFAHLLGLPNLEVLGCDGELSDDVALGHFAAIPRLKRVRIQESVATDNGFGAGQVTVD